MSLSVGLVVPTLNAGTAWRDWLGCLSRQTLRPDRMLVLDSASDDETPALAAEHGMEVMRIERGDFDHGRTRQLAANLLKGSDVLVYLTQDALLAESGALERLVSAFDDPAAGAAYGRQLPHAGAGPIEAHARLFNYPAESYVVDLAQARLRGLKGPFLSNSFAAYRATALHQAGGFPPRVIVSEDMYVGARMLLAGWHIAYRADACVHHSHGYSLAGEFRRYFDVGAFHACEPWVRREFGGAAGEGRRFVISELRHLCRSSPGLMVSALFRTLVKYTAFHLGLSQRVLPLALKRRFSQQKQFWQS